MSHIDWLRKKRDAAVVERDAAKRQWEKAQYKVEIIAELLDYAEQLEDGKKTEPFVVEVPIDSIDPDTVKQETRIKPAKNPNRIITQIYNPITPPVKNYIKDHWGEDKPITVLAREIFRDLGYNIHHKTLKKYVNSLKGSIAGNKKKAEDKDVKAKEPLIILKEEALVERMQKVSEIQDAIDPKTPILVNGKPTTVEEWKKQAELVDCKRDDMQWIALGQCRSFQEKWISDPSKPIAKIQLKACFDCPNGNIKLKEIFNVQTS